MFTSIDSFRHALTHALTQPAGRVSRVGRRMGAGVAAVAFCAMLPSPAAAQPTLVPPVVESAAAVVETGLQDVVPAGIAATDDPLGDDTSAQTSPEDDKDLSEVALSARAARVRIVTRRVMGVAAAQTGAPYVYGASGPNAFDCSGLTSFVYRVAAGRNLPHSSAAQAGVTQRISRAAARPGDLVFFHGSGGIYHVGIFAGGNSLIHASKPGVPVGRAQIWSKAVSFGRVR